MKKTLISLCFSACSVCMAFGDSNRLSDEYALRDSYNSIRIPGEILWETRPGYGTEPGLWQADLNSDGTIDYKSRKLLMDSKAEHEKLKYAEYDHATVTADRIFNLHRHNDSNMYLYSNKISEVVGGGSLWDNYYNLPAREYYGFAALSDTKFVAVYDTDRGPKACVLIGDDPVNGNLKESGCARILPIFKDKHKNTLKIRRIPGSDYVVVFGTTHDGSGYTIRAEMYKVRDNNSLEKTGQSTVKISNEEGKKLTGLQITDIKFVHDNGGVPGFVILAHYTNTEQQSSTNHMKNVVEFIEIISKDKSGENLSLDNYFHKDLKGYLFGGDRATVPRIIYPYTKSSSRDEYLKHLKVFGGEWYGSGAKYYDTTSSKYKLDKDNPASIVDDKGFNPLRFTPTGVVFGAPPRYKDSTAAWVASSFVIANSQADTGIDTSSFSLSSSVTLGRSAGPFSGGVTYNLTQSGVDSNKITSSKKSSMEFTTQSYGKKSAWVVGQARSYGSKLYKFIEYNYSSNKPINIYDKEDNTHINYPIVDFVFADTPKNSGLTDITFDITKPSKILDKFKKRDTYSTVTKGLPSFPNSEDIKNLEKNDLVLNWVSKADEDRNKYYDVKMVKIPTNVTKEGGYTITNEKSHKVLTDQSVTLEASIFGQSSSSKVSWSASNENITNKQNDWKFKYIAIEYSKVKKDRFTVDAYIFLPKNGATANDLPWSSDYMKENNIVTWAVAYDVKTGITKN
ncbi:hypothetical protein FLM55_01440 [Francisella sp. Scap27]|uniref:hypothetical protein n=1 Tax=Francisella sp. Scap27 TaxID=2589986 RepID=UPI0015BA48D3|nr:hypothetical protein [Francisella sp. Scap27]QLE78475.1 hypothetical protein FLM55_01440 [Francisella sp. Scap27]